MSRFFPKVATTDFFPAHLRPPRLRKSVFVLSFIIGASCLQAQSPVRPDEAAFITPTILGFVGGITLALVAGYFILKRLWLLLKAHKLYELQLCAEKDHIAREKEVQQRFYANFIHEVIKGEAQCLLVESTAGDNVRDHLAEFVKTCELGQTFVDQSNNNLFDLMKNIEFIYSNRLHSEMEERYFSCDIDPVLKEITLDCHQKYELIFFLRECLNNIRKYAGYKHISLKAGLEKDAKGKSPKVILEIRDDGKGLQHTLNLPEPEVEITEQNLVSFYKKYLQQRRCTGIREIFSKAAKLKGKLTISSKAGEGTSVLLHFGVHAPVLAA